MELFLGHKHANLPKKVGRGLILWKGMGAVPKGMPAKYYQEPTLLLSVLMALLQANKQKILAEGADVHTEHTEQRWAS